jgi:Mn2+/Fe2+ NRAMP family transporter
MAEEKDESAALFFFMTILGFIVVPWSWFVLSAILYPGAQQIAAALPSTTQDGKHRYRYCGTAGMAELRER